MTKLPDWSGKMAVIIASGPGLIREQVECVGCLDIPTIAINSTFKLAPWAAGSGAFNISAYRVVGEAPRPAASETAAASAQDTITATLAERGKRYGVFSKHAEVTQAIKHALFTCRDRSGLAPDQVEALEMIAHKLGRIVNGDPDYADSWVDIAGYAKLVVDRLQGVSR